jgi:hypothetical protein
MNRALAYLAISVWLACAPSARPAWAGDAGAAEHFGTPLVAKAFNGQGRLALQELRLSEYRGSINRAVLGEQLLFRELTFTVSAPDWKVIGTQMYGGSTEPETQRAPASPQAPGEPPGLRLTGIIGGTGGAIRYDETARLSPEGVLSVEAALTAVQPPPAIVNLGPCFGFLAPAELYRGKSLRAGDVEYAIPTREQSKAIIFDKQIPARLTIPSPDGLGAFAITGDPATKYLQISLDGDGILHFDWYLSGGEALLKPGGTVTYRFQMDFSPLLQSRLMRLAPGADGKLRFREEFDSPDSLRLALPSPVAFVRKYDSTTSLATRKGGEDATAIWHFALDQPREVCLRAKSNNYGADWCRLYLRRGTETEWSPVGEWAGKPWDFQMKPVCVLTPAQGDRFDLRIEVVGNMDDGVSGGLDWFEVYTP